MAGDSRSSSDHETRPEDRYEHVSAPTTSTQHSLSHAVHKRRAEFIRPRDIRIKIGSWNVAACKDVEKDIGGWFVEGKGVDRKPPGYEAEIVVGDNQEPIGMETAEDQEARRTKKQSTLPLNDPGVVIGRGHVDLYVLGLQEVVELSSAKEYITRVYTDPGPAIKWKKAMASALPDGYKLVSEQQLSGLLLLIYASPEISPTIGSVSSVSVGTGFLGYLGNKGAVTTRIVLGETTSLVFVNCHLASGTGNANLDRRCWDVTQILSRTHFDPISRAGVLEENQEGIGDADFAFWLGDLNFRLEGLPGDDIRRLLMLHTRGEYGKNSKAQKKIDEELNKSDEPIVIHHVDSDDDSDKWSPPRSEITTKKSDDTDSEILPDPDDFVQDPHSDPASLQATIDSLLPHDELRHVQKKRLAFHDGWREGPIAFLPTYKYDVGSTGLFDSSEKKRAPSWCDRILFRTRRDKLIYDGKKQDEELARLKDEEMKARGMDHATDDEDVLFDYDPESDGADADGNADYKEDEDAATDMQEVLTKEGYVDTLQLEVYTSHQRVLSSDHKPLDAVFALRCDTIVPELRSKVQQEVARELDRAENEGRPGITVVIDHSHEEADNVALPKSAQSAGYAATSDAPPLQGVEGVEFGEVRYLNRKCRGLTIANTGRVPANFSFVSRPAAAEEGERTFPEWLKLDLIGSHDCDAIDASDAHLEADITLEPGDAINVTLQVFVESIAQVRALNEGALQLDDILVLRVVDGRDHFIPVRGAWMQSCFGRSIDELIRVPEGGVRALLPRRHGSNSAPINRGQDVRWSAPRELFKLTDAVETLTERAIADKDMLENANFPADSPGWPFEESSWIVSDRRVREVRRSFLLEALDTDQGLIESLPPDINAVDKLESVSEVLLQFLASLDDGIITAALWDRLEQEMMGRKQALQGEDEKTWILDVLSSAPNHNISFVFLTSMLAKVAAELAPLPRSGTSLGTGSAKSSLDQQRRSLSFKGRRSLSTSSNTSSSSSSSPFHHHHHQHQQHPHPHPDPAVQRRRAMDRRWAEIFAAVVIHGGPGPARERERRAADDRKRQTIAVFLPGEDQAE